MFIETSAKAGFNIKVRVLGRNQAPLNGFYVCACFLCHVRRTGPLPLHLIGIVKAAQQTCVSTSLKTLPGQQAYTQVHRRASACMPRAPPSRSAHCLRQALFRKIAAALPGMESLSAAKQEDLVDVNLSPASAKAGSGSGASSCAC